MNLSSPANSIAYNSHSLCYVFTLLFFFQLSNLQAQVEKIEVVFNQTSDYTNFSVQYPVNVEGSVFFILTKNKGTWETSRYELWKTDGTGTGTKMVKDLGNTQVYPTVQTGYDGPVTFPHLNGVIYFVYSDSEHGKELWKSDGTEAGTKMVKDINPGLAGSHANNMMVVGNTLYFSANHSVYGTELWKTDGTETGTVLVKDIYPGTNPSNPQWLMAVGNELFFTSMDPVHGQELWKSDGTEAGTVMVKDISPTSGINLVRWSVAANNTVYFDAYLPETGHELWKSDGTEEGTVMVKELYPGTVSGSVALSQKSVIGDKVYFFGYHPSYGGELWVSDGTSEGTVLVKDVNPGTPNGIGADMRIPSGNYHYFRASNPTYGAEIWRTDGTESETIMLKDITTGSGSTSFNWFTPAPDNTLYFTAKDPEYGIELWVSNGTPEGTTMVADLEPGIDSSLPQALFLLNDNLYFFTGGNAKPLAMQKLSVAAPAPVVITPSTVEPTLMNADVEMSAPLTDMTLKSATWDWGDGNTSNAIIDFENKVITGSHAYATPGVYTVTLIRGTNSGEMASLASTLMSGTSVPNATGEVIALYQYVVIYDANGGFVTGGGWIESPAGAYKPDLDMSGKANFGFVSKYNKGASKPSGNTNFEFKTGSLFFESTAYDWLVVSGATAQFKGEGTINGSGNYRFILAATDGQVNGGGGYDKFRIKIWDKNNNGAIVYDNNLANENDNALATMAIAGGAVVVHVPKKTSTSDKALIATKPSENIFYCYPTALSNSTTIVFALNKPEAYRIEIFDLKGRLVKEIAAGVGEANLQYQVEFDSKGMSDGVYITRLTTSSSVRSLKTVLKR